MKRRDEECSSGPSKRKTTKKNKKKKTKWKPDLKGEKGKEIEADRMIYKEEERGDE